MEALGGASIAGTAQSPLLVDVVFPQTVVGVRLWTVAPLAVEWRGDPTDDIPDCCLRLHLLAMLASPDRKDPTTHTAFDEGRG